MEAATARRRSGGCSPRPGRRRARRAPYRTQRRALRGRHEGCSSASIRAVSAAVQPSGGAMPAPRRHVVEAVVVAVPGRCAEAGHQVEDALRPGDEREPVPVGGDVVAARLVHPLGRPTRTSRCPSASPGPTGGRRTASAARPTGRWARAGSGRGCEADGDRRRRRSAPTPGAAVAVGDELAQDRVAVASPRRTARRRCRSTMLPIDAASVPLRTPPRRRTSRGSARTRSASGGRRRAGRSSALDRGEQRRPGLVTPCRGR